MTEDELQEIEARADIPALIAALREAWAERQQAYEECEHLRRLMKGEDS